MNDNVMTADDEHIAEALHALRRGTKEVSRLAENYRPSLGGERYMTDKEVAQRLKVSRRTLQEYRNDRKIPFIIFGGKSCTEKQTSKGYWKRITGRQSGKNRQGANHTLRFAPCLFFYLTQKAVFQLDNDR